MASEGTRWERAEPHSKPFIGDNGYPVRDHPTLYRCPATLKSGNKCPAYLNHDGNGYLYCIDDAEHAGRCPECGADDPMGDEDAWHKDDCVITNLPRHAYFPGRGKVQVLSYDGNGMFTVLTNRDVKVFVHRDRLTFTK